MRFDTFAIHPGQDPDPTTGAVTIPVFLTSTHVQAGSPKHKGPALPPERQRTQSLGCFLVPAGREDACRPDDRQCPT